MGPKGTPEAKRDRIAKVASRTATWLRSSEADAVRAGFRTEGVAVFDHRPEHHYVHQLYGRSAAKLKSPMDDDLFRRLADPARDDDRTYLYYDRLHTLYCVVQDIARRFPIGPLSALEVGVYRGGSTRFLASALDTYAPGRGRVCGVDTFTGHDLRDLPHGEEGVHTPEKFKDTSFEDVVAYLGDFPSITVVKGRIQEVASAVDDRLHLIHADADLYEPTRFVLELAADRLVPGGMVVVDDVGFMTCPGTERAVREVLERTGDTFSMVRLPTGQAALVRVG